jgi:Flp pilus assembly pilin Flp
VTRAGNRVADGDAPCHAYRGRRAGEGEGMRSFWHDEHGQGLIEYALILSVISVAIILVMIFFKDQLSNLFSSIGNNLT